MVNISYICTYIIQQMRDESDERSTLRPYTIHANIHASNTRKHPLINQKSNIINHNSTMFNYRPYGKAELALLYHPYSSPETAMKTLYRWIKGCPMLMQELESMNYQPRRRTFLKPEVEAIVRHLGEP